MNNGDMQVNMKHTTHGISTSLVEVTNISPYGFWLLIKEEELFLPYSEFPWFKEFLAVVEAMHREFDSDVFGKQKDDSFDSSANQI
jgi:hypothetical protein